jgi:FkbM family methyltransferase
MNSLAECLKHLGGNEKSRSLIVEALLKSERELAKLDFDVREKVTGPIVDAMCDGIGVMSKKLSSGVTIQFLYRSKIARDFVMSADPEPDHVWEPQTTKLLLYLAKSAKNVAVAGAYCGDQAVLMAKTIAPNGGICHCFEPNPDQIAMLKKNAEFNGIQNMKFTQKCVWNKDGERLVLVGDDSFAHPEEARGADEGIETIRFDTYGSQNGIDQLDLFMLDIEGAEMAALTGAEKYLAAPDGLAPTLVFEVHRHYLDWSNGLEETEIGKMLKSHGYTLFCVRDYQSNEPMHGKPIELIPANSAYLEGPPHGFNMLAVKNPTKLLADSDTFKVVPGVSPKLLRHRDPKIHAPLH